VRIEVWDTGIGIDREALQHVFEEFYQTDNPERDRSRGLGLGLAISKRVATLLGHKLGVRSWPGRGSVFHVTLPAATEPATEAGTLESPAGQRAGLEGRVVLLIDDDPMVLEGTQAMLEDWGCAVIAAASTSEAVEKVASGAMAPDVAIADLRLRGSETGLAAIASLNEVLAHPVPAVIVTGDTDPGRIRQVSASGLIILHKPVEPAKLQTALTEAICGNSEMSGRVDSSHQTTT
jgi:two-component system CheB/CheR fusion protein